MHSPGSGRPHGRWLKMAITSHASQSISDIIEVRCQHRGQKDIKTGRYQPQPQSVHPAAIWQKTQNYLPDYRAQLHSPRHETPDLILNTLFNKLQYIYLPWFSVGICFSSSLVFIFFYLTEGHGLPYKRADNKVNKKITSTFNLYKENKSVTEVQPCMLDFIASS